MTIAQRTPAVDQSGPRAALLERLGPLLEAAVARPTPTLVSATVPVQPIDPIAAYAAAPETQRSLWLQSSSDLGLVGIGEAWSVVAGGASRFVDVSRSWSALSRAALVDTEDSPRGSGPLLLGGFAFDDDPSVSTLWRSFEPASMVLPELLLTSTPERTWLTLSLVSRAGGSPLADVERLVGTWDGIRAVGSTAARPTPTGALRVTARRPEAPAWRDAVARLAGAVGRGRLDKAVLSRRVSLRAEGPIDVPDVLRRLEASAPESTVFAASRGSATFVGATPERLISLRAGELHTMAMAGSRPRGRDAAADDALAAELLRSDKEREEHAVVVTMLREALNPLADQLQIPSRPEVVGFRHVQHLVTPISGRLRQDADILALVERLHPTPAVGGAPRELALELIADEEPDERGWYAGPLGWVDRRGDGEFVVALRSGVVAGNSATLFAGCGIVADSDPEREWDESSTKLLALGSALGRVQP